MSVQPGQIVITDGDDITDGMLIPLDTGGAQSASMTVAALAAKVAADEQVALPFSKTASQVSTSTIQVGGITGAVTPCLNLTGTVAPVTLYTPTALEIVAALEAQDMGVGSAYQFRLGNLLSTTGIGTLTATQGVTISGSGAIPGVTNNFATFEAKVVSATAVTITRVG